MSIRELSTGELDLVAGGTNDLDGISRVAHRLWSLQFGQFDMQGGTVPGGYYTNICGGNSCQTVVYYGQAT